MNKSFFSWEQLRQPVGKTILVGLGAVAALGIEHGYDTIATHASSTATSEETVTFPVRVKCAGIAAGILVSQMADGFHIKCEDPTGNSEKVIGLSELTKDHTKSVDQNSAIVNISHKSIPSAVIRFDFSGEDGLAIVSSITEFPDRMQNNDNLNGILRVDNNPVSH